MFCDWRTYLNSHKESDMNLMCSSCNFLNELRHPRDGSPLSQVFNIWRWCVPLGICGIQEPYKCFCNLSWTYVGYSSHRLPPLFCHFFWFWLSVKLVRSTGETYWPMSCFWKISECMPCNNFIYTEFIFILLFTFLPCRLLFAIFVIYIP